MSWRRNLQNPILVRDSIPEFPGCLVDPSSVFNPGATRIGNRVVLLLRVQARSRETHLLKATSDDGVHFRFAEKLCTLEGLDAVGEAVHHVYDPRITRIDDTHYVMLALDLDTGCRLGLARTVDFETLEFLGTVSDTDMRNGVLFPEKVAGRYLRLDRPNDLQPSGAGATGTEIHLSASDDLLTWEPVGRVCAGRPRLWDERIGPGTPPIKTRAGWLTVYHGVATHFDSVNIYQAGLLLLDLEDPTKVVARSRHNCLEPRETYELIGQVPNVVFPSGLVADDDEDEEGFIPSYSLVHLYYGAADTSVCLATASIEELIADCRG